jgi:hypothetical protein
MHSTSYWIRTQNIVVVNKTAFGTFSESQAAFGTVLIGGFVYAATSSLKRVSGIGNTG